MVNLSVSSIIFFVFCGALRSFISLDIFLIDGRIVKDAKELCVVRKSLNVVEANSIELKFQLADRKKPIIKTIVKSSSFKQILTECAAELGCSAMDLKLRYKKYLYIQCNIYF